MPAWRSLPSVNCKSLRCVEMSQEHMARLERMRRLFAAAWGLAGLSIVLCVVWAGAAWCDPPDTMPPGTTLPLGMPQQMSDALRIIIPSPTSSNAVLIDDQQRSSLADLPGRLIVLKGSPYVPAMSLMQNYRMKGAKVEIESGPEKPPVRATQLEVSETKSVSFLARWFGFDHKKTRKCLVELKATPAPSVAMSSGDLDIDLIYSELIEKIPLEKRLCLGIILSATPYEVHGSLGMLESKPAQLGVWYIKVGRDWYSRSADEQRLYYLVAAYVPPITPEEALQTMVSGTTTTIPDPWKIASVGGLVSGEMLSAWMGNNNQCIPKFGVVRSLPTLATIVDTREPDRL